MKPQKPINIHSLREPTIGADSAETPSLSMMKKMKARRKWRRLFTQRRCPDCMGELSDLIAFKQLPIGFCSTCQEEKVL